MVPAVAVLNEYEYVTFAAATWLFDTDQFTVVNAAAPAGAAPTTASPAPKRASARTIRRRAR